MKKNRWTLICLVVLCATLFLTLSACNKDDGDNVIGEKVELRFVGSVETWPAMQKVIGQFEKKYPECTVKYEFMENYFANLPTRLKTDAVDVFTTTNITTSTAYKDDALNLISEESKKYLDLSQANADIVNNFKYTGAENTQYAVPYAGELRGLYVNKTLLSSLNLEVPTKWSELMHCCEVLLDAGYVPFQANVGDFGQQFIYPYICNLIVQDENYQAKYEAIDSIDEGIAEYFRPAYATLYEIVEKGYYDYKRVEGIKYATEDTEKITANETAYSFGTAVDKARTFLNVTPYKVVDGTGKTTEKYIKNDDVGTIAFMTDTQGFVTNIDKVKEDFGSDIDYEFILAPVTEQGGYGYLSPASGLAINKNSANTVWALKFINFVMSSDVNKALAEDEGKISNSKDVSAEMQKLGLDANHYCTVGDMTFSYSNFYKTIVNLTTGYSTGGPDDMVGISKMNAPKYKNADGTLKFTLNDYIVRLETEFQKLKAAQQK